MTNNINQNQNLLVGDDQQNQNLSNCPYIKEISYENGVRNVKIVVWKSMYWAIVIFLVLEIIEIIISLFFYFSLGLTFTAIGLACCLLPIFIIFLLIPIGINCQIDYNSSNFTCQPFPTIPITYNFLKTSMSFNEINYFFIFKVQQFNKKYYKFGINKKDGDDLNLVTGQDASCSTEYDPKLKLIADIMNNWLKSEH